MRTVLKWNVPVDDRDHPIGSGLVVLVACQFSADVVQVWTEESDEVKPHVGRRARVYATGQSVPESEVHIGSAVSESGHLVWHLYGSKVA